MKLSTHHIHKRFGGVHAVNGVTLEFLPGKITGIVGPNGSGKTTLIQLISGVIPFDLGHLEIGDDTKLSHVHSWNIRRFGVTRTFQNVRVFEQMTVMDNILVVLTERHVFRSLFDRYSSFMREQSEEILKTVGLWEKRDALAHNLSYGQRKLLEIGRALVLDADIYLFDEPFAGLFPEMIRLVADIMQDLKAKGKTVILIEHNMNLIRSLSDHLVVMDVGEVIAEGDPNHVLSQANVKEAYLGE